MPGERHDRVLALTARRDERGILDYHRRKLEPHEHVRPTLESPAERGELNGLLLQRAVGKRSGMVGRM